MTELGSIHDIRDADIRYQATEIVRQALLIGELSDENRDLRLERDMLIETIRQQAEWLRGNRAGWQAALIEKAAGIYQQEQK